MLQDFLKGKKKKPQRVGRGGKRGTTAGRGTKGQKSRAGRRIRPAERDLVIRIPKRRGFRNKPTSDTPMVFNLNNLKGRVKALIIESKGVLSPDTLRDSKLITSRYKGKIKLLGQGDVDFAVTVRGLEVSEGAKEKIEKAGGKVEAPNTK